MLIFVFLLLLVHFLFYFQYLLGYCVTLYFLVLSSVYK